MKLEGIDHIALAVEDQKAFTVAHSIYFTDPDGYRLEITTYDLG